MSTKEQRDRIELLQGTLDLLILRTLQLGPAHGHAIAKAIELAAGRPRDEVVVVCLSGRGDKDAFEVARLRKEAISDE